MVNQEQAAGGTHSTLVYQVSMTKTYVFVRAQCLRNSCFCVVCQIIVMSLKEEREQCYTIQFLHRQGKNHVETLHAIQMMYGEEALLGIPLSLFLARHHRCNLTDHAKTIVC